MPLPQVLRLPISSAEPLDDSGIVLIHVNGSHGPASDLKLSGTDGAETFTISSEFFSSICAEFQLIC